MDYNQNGNYLALAGLAAMLLSKFGITATADTIMLIIGGIVSFVGIVKQIIAHKQLAVKAGAIKR